MRLLVGCLVAAVLLAGCTADPQPAAKPNSNNPGSPGSNPGGSGPGGNGTGGNLSKGNTTIIRGPPPAPEVTQFNVSLTLGVGTAMGHVADFGWDGVPAGFTVHENYTATGLVIEGKWTCSSPTCKLGVLISPPGSSGITAEADKEFRQEFQPPADSVPAGNWGINLDSHDVVVQIDGTFYATVFYDGPVPSGYTAFTG